MKLKLDKIDKKLLSYLFHNFRKPITQIAKNCRISREQAEYRIKKYEKSGLINRYLTAFNLYMFGYREHYTLRLRVKNPKSKNLDKLCNKNILIFTRLHSFGEWDYILAIFAKNKTDFLNFISTLFNSWKEDLLDYSIFEPTEVHFYPLKIFGKREDDKTLSFKEDKEIKFDVLDKKLMTILAKNADIKIVDLARKLKEKVKTISYRLKRLEKNIIVGYRIFLDLSKIGYNLAQLSIKLNDLSDSTVRQLRQYAKQRESVHAFNLGIGKYNTMFQIIYQNPKEVNEEINKLKEIFKEKIIEFDVTFIDKELSPTLYP